MNNSTIVTGIWDLNREALSQDWSRSFDHYINNFKNLLSCQNLNLAIFIDPSLKDLVWSIRDRSNTAVYHHPKENFSGNFFPFFDKIQQIRNNPEWYNQVGWLADSTQAKMEYYNPMVMSKMFLLHNAKIFNPFDSDYYWWLDGGITNTVHSGYFTHDNIIEKIEDIVNKFLFVCFPYETSSEIHGFDIEAMKKYCQSDTVNRVARGGFFGGHKDYISQANDEYYSLLDGSLREGYMGTEESIFTIMTYLDPNIYQYEPIEDNGLINTFFENVKNKNTQLKNKHSTSSNKNNDIILYINTFNTPLQLELLIDSYEKYDSNFLTKTQKYLINNSTDYQYNEHYNQICSKYDFNQIKKGNLGVCGGRQWAAEHFAELGAKYMFFFEDDMLIDLSDTECRFGLRKNIKDLFDRIVRLMDIEDYDWIKLSFSEFYGHNGEQWSWHNVPQNLKNEYFPNIKSRPQTRFHNIKSYSGLPYADGEIYYSNWPHIIGQEGNKKSFLDTKWDRPFEQTWMSHMYTLTKQEIIKPAILLASPITHNRIYFYEGTQRKES
jgi:hypothetical protein